MTTNYPKPFRQKDSKNWFFRYTDGVGFRRTKTTGTSNKTQAQKFIREFIDRLQHGGNSDATLGQIIELYKDPETNPRFIDATTAGGSYGIRYATKISREAVALTETLKTVPGFLSKELYNFSRRDIKDAAQIIVNAHGKTTKAKGMYKLLKLVFSQAADDGLIQLSPSQGLPDIKAQKVRTMYVLPAADIKFVISKRELFPSEIARDIFIVLAACGLRRSELLALNPEQLKGNALIVDRAYKDDSCTIVGPPKWGKVRVIALADIAKEALGRLFSYDNALNMTTRSLYLIIKKIGLHASLHKELIKPEAWKNITPHMLRHSLTTMLRLSGIPDVLVAEYMSWAHQDQSTLASKEMLENYTQVYTENLSIVAEKIDELIGDEQDDNSDNVIQIASWHHS
jgi:integrase